jgi:hypothetical protein
LVVSPSSKDVILLNFIHGSFKLGAIFLAIQYIGDDSSRECVAFGRFELAAELQENEYLVLARDNTTNLSLVPIDYHEHTAHVQARINNPL